MRYSISINDYQFKYANLATALRRIFEVAEQGSREGLLDDRDTDMLLRTQFILDDDLPWTFSLSEGVTLKLDKIE